MNMEMEDSFTTPMENKITRVMKNNLLLLYRKKALRLCSLYVIKPSLGLVHVVVNDKKL